MRLQVSRRHGRPLRLRGLGGEGQLGRIQRNPRKGAGTEYATHITTYKIRVYRFLRVYRSGDLAYNPFAGVQGIATNTMVGSVGAISRLGAA